jgi:hypothetical protein
MVNLLTIGLIILGLFIGLPVIFGEPSTFTFLFGGGITVLGVMIFLKNTTAITTKFKKKSLGGRAVDKTRKAVKKRKKGKKIKVS